VINLVIDIGNTRTKVALFNQGELIISFPVSSFSPDDFEILIKEYPNINNAIVSSVKDNQETLIFAIKKLIPFVVELDQSTVLPIQNCYETPETLGKDRIAAAVGANKLFPNQNVLVIDAGTAIKYDFINEKNQYTGGYITPGLNMRFMALNQFTDKLPLLKPEMPGNFDGKNTKNSIRGGIQHSLEGEINQMIHYFNDLYGKLTIILTGGDSNYFEKLLKSYKFVTHEIILLGLNTILEFNIFKEKNKHYKT
jgi:type III pantothenate kinase